MLIRRSNQKFVVIAAALALTTGTAFASPSNETSKSSTDALKAEARGGGGGGGGHGGGGNVPRPNPGNGGHPGNGGGHPGGNPGNGGGHPGGGGNVPRPNPGNGGHPGNGGGHPGGNPGNGGGHPGGNPGNGGHPGGNPGNGGGNGHPGNGGGNNGHPGNGGGNGHPGNGGGNNGHPGNGGGNNGHPGNGGGNNGHPGNGGGNGHPGNGGGGNGHPGNGGGNNGHPGNGGGNGHPGNGGGSHYGRDHHGNIVSPHWDDRIRDSDRRSNDYMRHDPRVVSYVNRYSSRYYNDYRPNVIRYDSRMRGYHDQWHDRYRSTWRSHGFCGGYYWDFHPYYEIQTYFYNPVVYWFYFSDWDDNYYRVWYNSDYDAYPELRRPYSRVGIFYPTEEFRDMNLYVSTMSIHEQVNYRVAVTVLGDRLAQELGRRFGAPLGQNEVVIDHYQVLPDDVGLVVEGFVGQGAIQFPFKALLDLEYPSSTTVFAPTTYAGTPTYDELSSIQQLNDRISDLGGEIEDDENVSL